MELFTPTGFSPRGMTLYRHSDLMDKTKRSRRKHHDSLPIRTRGRNRRQDREDFGRTAPRMGLFTPAGSSASSHGERSLEKHLILSSRCDLVLPHALPETLRDDYRASRNIERISRLERAVTSPITAVIPATEITDPGSRSPPRSVLSAADSLRRCGC